MRKTTWAIGLALSLLLLVLAYFWPSINERHAPAAEQVKSPPRLEMRLEEIERRIAIIEASLQAAPVSEAAAQDVEGKQMENLKEEFQALNQVFRQAAKTFYLEFDPWRPDLVEREMSLDQRNEMVLHYAIVSLWEGVEEVLEVEAKKRIGDEWKICPREEWKVEERTLSLLMWKRDPQGNYPPEYSWGRRFFRVIAR